MAQNTGKKRCTGLISPPAKKQAIYRRPPVALSASNAKAIAKAVEDGRFSAMCPSCGKQRVKPTHISTSSRTITVQEDTVFALREMLPLSPEEIHDYIHIYTCGGGGFEEPEHLPGWDLYQPLYGPPFRAYEAQLAEEERQRIMGVAEQAGFAAIQQALSEGDKETAQYIVGMLIDSQNSKLRRLEDTLEGICEYLGQTSSRMWFLGREQ